MRWLLTAVSINKNQKSRGTCSTAGFLFGGPMSNTENQNEEVDALCRECGHAFKSYIDRILRDDNDAGENKKVECPVCGCTDCKIGQ